MQVSVVHFSTNPVNTVNSMSNTRGSGRSTSKNNAASENKFSNYAYGDKAYELKDVRISYVDKFHNFVIVADSPVIPKWDDAGEFTTITKYSIGPQAILGKLYQIKGFGNWWEAAKSNANVEAAGAATKNAINSFIGVDLEAEAMQAILNFNFGVVKPDHTDALYRKLGDAITINGVFLPLTKDEDYIYSDGTKSDKKLGHDGYRVAFDFNITLSDELMAEINK